jgi:hypothetical protein
METDSLGQQSLQRKRKKKGNQPIAIALDKCKYDVIRRVVASLGWKEVNSEQKWDLQWSDCSVAPERVMRLIPGQVTVQNASVLDIPAVRSSSG